MIPKYADHSSNERTFLAWVRTVIAIVGFGLGAGKLSAEPAPIWSDVVLLGAGALVVLIAYLRMRALRRAINSDEESDDESEGAGALLVALVAALFALLASFALHVS
ncbi:MAG: YidH family protein [Pseudodonghicola sp.]|uniref:YidH family protein n=1 Tax=Pseudodonghicola sp. TaxID=1969463 RepID=UPI003A9733E0